MVFMVFANMANRFDKTKFLEQKNAPNGVVLSK
jgi:hypothetical protein